LDHLLGQQDIHLSQVKFTHSDGETPYRILVQHTITAQYFLPKRRYSPIRPHSPFERGYITMQ
jgi:hypothetical protein